jgi:uncharacterized protein (TIGR02246 family)
MLVTAACLWMLPNVKGLIWGATRDGERSTLRQHHRTLSKGDFAMPAHTPEECDLLLIDTVNRGDVDAAVALYEPQASYVLDSGQVIAGRAAIREACQNFLAYKPRFTIEVKALRSGEGDLALTTSTWTVTGVNPEDGTPMKVSGKSAEVVRRQADGTWQFVIDNPHGGE